MSPMEHRAKQLISKAGFDRLIRESEIGHARWKSVRYRNIRISTNELEVLERIFPRYALWLISGKTAPEVGQISPENDEVNSKLGSQAEG
nr:hypothetical protein [Marinobacter salexigens]